MTFRFDPISILSQCQQTELLFSMFVQSGERLGDLFSFDKTNTLLLDNIREHLFHIHSHELELTYDECERFMHHLVDRHQNKYSHMCPLSDVTLKGGYLTF